MLLKLTANSSTGCLVRIICRIFVPALSNVCEGQTQPPELELPNLWIWDLVDEFIYQYQEFSQYIYKLLRDKQKQSIASEELALIKANPEARFAFWNIIIMLYLTIVVVVERSYCTAILAGSCR